MNDPHHLFDLAKFEGNNFFVYFFKQQEIVSTWYDFYSSLFSLLTQHL